MEVAMSVSLWVELVSHIIESIITADYVMGGTLKLWGRDCHSVLLRVFP